MLGGWVILLKVRENFILCIVSIIDWKIFCWRSFPTKIKYVKYFVHVIYNNVLCMFVYMMKIRLAM